MRIFAALFATCAVVAMMMSCSSNPSDTGNNTPTDTTKIAGMEKLAPEMWWTTVTYDTLRSDTISSNTVHTIYDTIVHHSWAKVVNLTLINYQIHFIVQVSDTILDPLSGTVSSITSDTIFVNHTSTGLNYMINLDSFLWDTVTATVMALPPSVSNSWSSINKSIDSIYRIPVYWFGVPVKAKIEADINGTGRIPAMVTYQGASQAYQCYKVENATALNFLAIADSIIIGLQDTIALVGDTLLSSRDSTIENQYYSIDFAVPMWTTKVQIKTDSIYIDVAKDVIRDTKKSGSYLLKYYESRIDSVFVIK